MLIISRCTELDRTVAVKSGECIPSFTDSVSGAITVQGPISVMFPWDSIEIVTYVLVMYGVGCRV